MNKRVAIVFTDVHLAYSPTTLGIYDSLKKHGVVVVGPGQIDAVLTSEAVSETFDIEVQVAHNTGRWAAMVVRS